MEQFWFWQVISVVVITRSSALSIVKQQYLNWTLNNNTSNFGSYLGLRNYEVIIDRYVV